MALALVRVVVAVAHATANAVVAACQPATGVAFTLVAVSRGERGSRRCGGEVRDQRMLSYLQQRRPTKQNLQGQNARVYLGRQGLLRPQGPQSPEHCSHSLAVVGTMELCGL